MGETVGGDRILESQGIHAIARYDMIECTEEPDRVVLEFLQDLNQA